MVSTINNPATGNSTAFLNFINNKSILNKFSRTEIAGLKPLSIKHERSVVALAKWLSESKIVTKLNYSINATRAVNDDQHTVTLNFVLAEKYADHFILLRGLFDFHNIAAVAVVASRSKRSFHIEAKTDNADLVINYIEVIFNSLLKEINFKTILKGIIRLEKRIRNEQNLAYASLQASV